MIVFDKIYASVAAAAVNSLQLVSAAWSCVKCMGTCW